MKIWSIMVRAVRYDTDGATVDCLVSSLLAPSQEKAIEQGNVFALQAYPPEEGWCNQNATVARVPDSWYTLKEVL